MLIAVYKDCPGPDSFDFPMAILIWKHLEAVKSGRKVTVANPLRKYVHLSNPNTLPTPGLMTVTSFRKILATRKERQIKKAKIREKVKKNMEKADAPIETVINSLEDDQELSEGADLDDLFDQLQEFPVGPAVHLDDEVDDNIRDVFELIY